MEKFVQQWRNQSQEALTVQNKKSPQNKNAELSGSSSQCNASFLALSSRRLFQFFFKFIVPDSRHLKKVQNKENKNKKINGYACATTSMFSTNQPEKKDQSVSTYFSSVHPHKAKNTIAPSSSSIQLHKANKTIVPSSSSVQPIKANQCIASNTPSVEPVKANQFIASKLSLVHPNEANMSISSNSLSNKLDQKRQSARKFLPHWLKTWNWIKYDDVSEKAFCSICTEAYSKIKIKVLNTYDRYSYNSYVVEGFSAWKNAISRFKAHETTKFHREAVVVVTSKNQGVNILNAMSKQTSESRFNARFCLMKIVETVRFLATQGIPLRGHDEEKSNFLQLLSLRSKDIPLLKSWLERSSYKWISHDVINEILEMLSRTVQTMLLDKIAAPPFYAIMADETTDASHKEQMSVNFRVVDENLKIHEHFLGFYETPFTDSVTLFNVIKDVLLRFNLPLCRCRGQCYDGANCVSGYISGLQTLFRQVEPRAYFTHCAGHNLNLVAQDGMSNIKQIASFLSEMKELATFIRGSAKRLEIFKRIQLQGDGDEDENESIDTNRKTTNIRSFCMTNRSSDVLVF